MGHVPGTVAEDLDLDVPRGLDQPLQEDQAVAERGRRLPAGARHGVRQRRAVADDPHAAAAAAERGLDQQRVADAVGHLLELAVVRR